MKPGTRKKPKLQHHWLNFHAVYFLASELSTTACGENKVSQSLTDSNILDMQKSVYCFLWYSVHMN